MEHCSHDSDSFEHYRAHVWEISRSFQNRINSSVVSQLHFHHSIHYRVAYQASGHWSDFICERLFQLVRHLYRCCIPSRAHPPFCLILWRRILCPYSFTCGQSAQAIQDLQSWWSQSTRCSHNLNFGGHGELRHLALPLHVYLQPPQHVVICREDEIR